MQAEAPQKTAVIREKPSQWVTADATDLQHPEDSGLAQVGIFTCSSPPEVPLEESLRFYVAHANAGNRNMSESPVTSDIFRYPPESRTAAAVALAADKEDRLLHLVRGYGCAVILANLITTFLCSMALMFFIGANAPVDPESLPASFALTPNIHVVPASPVTKLEDALANPRSVVITAFDSEGFSVKYRHDVIGWEASRDRSSATLFLSSNRRLIVTSTSIIFEDHMSGSRLAEWELWGEKGAENAPHAVLRDALHAVGEGTSSSVPPTTDEVKDQLANPLISTKPEDTNSSLTSRRLSMPMTTPSRQFPSLPPSQLFSAVQNSLVHPQPNDAAYLFVSPSVASW